MPRFTVELTYFVFRGRTHRAQLEVNCKLPRELLRFLEVDGLGCESLAPVSGKFLRFVKPRRCQAAVSFDNAYVRELSLEGRPK